jgi:transposase
VKLENVDARLIAPQAQEDLRRRVVSAVERGMSQVEAAEVFDVSTRSVSRWWNAFQRKGSKALISGKPGQRPGVQKALSKARQKTLCRTILAQSPAQSGGEGLLWTRAEVAALIMRRYRIRLSLPTIGKYLRSWGLSPQRPVRRAYEQNPVVIRTWLTETYPAIVAAAKAEGGIVLWLDESGISSSAELGTTWTITGHTPVLPKTGQRFRVNLMAAINNQGRLHFMVYQGSLTVARYRTFLDRLATDHAGSRVHLIADQHPTHKAKSVKAWLAENDQRIIQHFLPGYAPELNPVELLNGDTKREVANKAAPRNRLAMAAAIRAHLHRLQKQPARVISFFHKPEVAYAAA